VARVGILAAADGWHIEALRRALSGAGLDAVRCDPRRLAGAAGAKAVDAIAAGGGAGVQAEGVALERLDGLIVRVVPPGSLDQIVFRIDALHLMADRGLPIVNRPRCLERTIDKHWTSRLLHDAGVPTPRTFVTERAEAALAAFRGLRDVVVKPLMGSGGRGIFRLSDEDLAWRSFQALERQRSVIYLQEFVPHGDSDLRAFVVGDRVVAAARRTGSGWKSNVAAGARASAHGASPAQVDLAVRAAQAVAADYAGVDLLEAEDGRLLVTEVNGIPGWSALQGTTSTDIAATIAALVRDRLRGTA
jgi:RimK family alpha-L-glutamate ligase